MHPRTKDCAEKFGIQLDNIFTYNNVKIIEPVSAFESLNYEKNAKVIITDSGCIQEEACIFKTPCITVRENTERPETLELGCNVVTGFDKNIIKKSFDDMINKNFNYKNPYGKYCVAKRIVDTLEKELK
jgi:UDP-N-acetylglucosamine 2-epimerase (non-hydrolysing)